MNQLQILIIIKFIYYFSAARQSNTGSASFVTATADSTSQGTDTPTLRSDNPSIDDKSLPRNKDGSIDYDGKFIINLC